MRSISLKQLRIVAAIAASGRVLAAAKALNVTPPAVTQQLRQLENLLGLPLFERTRDRMKPTAAGQVLLGSAKRIETELTACWEELSAMRGLKGGSVSIGVVSTAKYFAPAALGAFARKYPELGLRLFIGNREETIRRLAALEFDIVIMGRPPEDLAVESAVLGDHPHVIIAPPGHPLCARRALAPKDLRDEIFLMREAGSGTRGLMTRFFGEAGVEPKAGMEMPSNETIKQAVMAGLGIAFISAHTIAAEIETKRLAILDVKGLPAWRQWRVVHHADKRLTPPAGALREFLIAEGSTFLPASLPVRTSRDTAIADWDGGRT